MITVAKSAGFCFGVNRALEIVNKLIDAGKTVYTLGPIIHNPKIVEELAERGVNIVSSPKEVPPESTLVIRSHGVSADIMEQAQALNIEVADATCPFVGKIHKIVDRRSKMGSTVIIAGDPKHPEVEGIRGHSPKRTYVFDDSKSLEKLLKENPELKQEAISVVAQTTFSVSEWNRSLEILKKMCTNATIFDTICSATSKRQSEAVKLSEESDLMIIIGGRQSSNTAKLKDVCEKNCKTFLIESADELPLCEVAKANVVGVTAGASTPAGIIKEAVNKMLQRNIFDQEIGAVEEKKEVSTVENKEEKQEILQAKPESADEDLGKMPPEEHPEKLEPVSEKFEDMLEESLKGFTTDNRVKGTVTNITPTEVFVDVGRKQAGFVPYDELTNEPFDNVEDIVKVGDVLELLIMKTNDAEGTIMLSKKRIDALKIWDEFKSACDNKEVMTGKVTDVIKGGVIARCRGQKVFIPASQATLSRGDSLDELKDKEVQFRIIEVNENRRRAVGSIKSILKEQAAAKMEEFWNAAEIGQRIDGVVKNITSYGAFVDIGGIDGLVHISELSWDRIKHPSEIVSVGDKINVYIKNLNKETGKVSLGYKDPGADPWEVLKSDYPEGSIVEVKIAGLTSFGAFGRIIPGVDGLIHISQISDRRIDKPQDVLRIGDTAMAMITKIDFDDKRVSLSIRRLLEDDPKFSDEKKVKDKEQKQEDEDKKVDTSVLSENVTFTSEDTSAKSDEELQKEALNEDEAAIEKAIKATEESPPAEDAEDDVQATQEIDGAVEEVPSEEASLDNKDEIVPEKE